MRTWLRGFFNSFPIQLVFLHFRKYQVLLIFWFIIFSAVNGGFMHDFGANSLFLAPEYLGHVNAAASAIVGISIGMFIMSWNITTFILFSKNFKFLAATTNPFLKYCINNAIIPLIFLIFYFIKAVLFDRYKELIPAKDILVLTGGFLVGLVIMFATSFAYFFGAHRTILRQMLPILNNPKEYITHLQPGYKEQKEETLIKVKWYLNTPFTIHKARNVSHYTQQFIDTVFKRHHFAAIISIFVAFLFLILIGFFLEYKFFQIPAAASMVIFFAILIAVSGAIAYFLESWSIPFLVVFILLINLFYRLDWIDPRNKAYGLNYTNKSERPEYSQVALNKLCSNENITADSLNMIGILNNWKSKQKEAKPLLFILATSGGGNRSATFTMSMLQKLDSVTSGDFFKKTFLVTGASGGMIGATYFRELYLQREKGKNINLQEGKYVDDIAGDLLNPLFSSFVARDLFSPAQKFSVGPYKYARDRGYAFEEKMNSNTRGFLDKSLYAYKDDEYNANIPLMFFNSVITRDGRKMITGTQPIRFMMKPRYDTLDIPAAEPDAVDFGSFFSQQNPGNLRLLTAMRTNATFPVVLPNVWLPSNPVIDVMDAGLRDNYGQETVIRFLHFFNNWIKENTSGVVIVQLRDRKTGGWEDPYVSDNLSEHFTKPFFLLQNNWYKMMEYAQNDLLSYYSSSVNYPLHKIAFVYTSANPESKAVLNFHLTQLEKKDIISSAGSPQNMASFKKVTELLSAKPVELTGNKPD